MRESPDPPDPEGGRVILTVNGGSSSIKFALFACSDPPQRVLSGQVERIGPPGTRLVASRVGQAEPDDRPVDASTFDLMRVQKIARAVAPFIGPE